MVVTTSRTGDKQHSDNTLRYGAWIFFGAVWSQGLDFSDPCESFPIWVILRFYECFVYVHKKGLSICHSSVKLN